jgi:uncharacterized protein YjbI with pentapeptide repeats
MKITTYKTNKKVQEGPEPSTERRVVDGFFLTIIDGVLIDVEYSNTSADVLTIPDDVRVISKQAFEDVCVKEVILPASLESIEDEAFKNSTLAKIDLTNVKFLGNKVFEFSELGEIIYSKYLTYIPERCFRGSNLAEFEIPKQVTALKTGCFEGTNLERIDLSGIITLEEFVFFDCFNLKEIILSETITEIPDGFCRRCQCLEKINLSHVQFIGASAFSECSNLDAGNLSAKIDRHAFEGTAVRNLDIKDISNLDKGVYQNCGNLESVTISGNGEIPDRLFSECNKLKNVTIGEGITAVGDSAFSKTAVEKIILPSTVIVVRSDAFRECRQLREVILNGGLKTIAESAFKQTENLSEISIPDSVKHIGSGCFACSGIKSVKLPENSAFTSILWETFFGCKNLETVKLPDSVNVIDDYAFSECTSLRSINLDKVQVIDSSAFAKTALEYITLSARKIGSGAFAQCENLKKADLSGIGTKKLDSRLFFECMNLNKISLPKNQIKIFGGDCFYHTAIKEITFDTEQITVGLNAFGKTNLKKVVISENCNDILFQDYAFREAEVEEFVIPDFLEKVINHDLERMF